MNVLIEAGRGFRVAVASVLIPAVLLMSTLALAQDRIAGAKVSIDSNGVVDVNNVEVYNPEGVMYADSGQVMNDAGAQGEEESWYTPTWTKFLIGLVFVGVVVGVAFIIDNNVDDDNDRWYYDSDCDCFKRR